MIVTGVSVATITVLIVKVAEVAPAGTTTVAGLTVATAVLPLETPTDAPPGAWPFSVTVRSRTPPATLAGLTVTEEMPAAVTESVAVLGVLPASVPVSVTDFVLKTPRVVTVKVPDVAPSAMCALAGTVAAVRRGSSARRRHRGSEPGRTR